jgi:NodT family efflux transporter outer membrane factor (OMF) lipoprotein
MLVTILVLPAACAVGPDYQPPAVDAGGDWVAPSAPSAPSGPAATTAAPASVTATEGLSDADLERGWTSLNDPTLDRLVETALEQNLDSRIASARVAEVRALRDAVAGRRLPAVGANGSVTRRRQSENGPLPIDVIPGLERDQTIFEAGFDAVWELDVFGANRRAVEAAAARADAALDLQRSVELRIAAETARSYIELRGAQHELEAVDAAIAASRGSTDLVWRQVSAGDVPAAALAQAEAALAAVEAVRPALEARVRMAALAIGILLGGVPVAEAALADSRVALIELAPLPVGQRADLLRRRPDVSAAERQLAAATADVGVATTELFPKIGIAANGGFQSLEAGDLLEAASETLAVGPLISWHVFDGGRVRAQIRASEARVEIAALE